MPTTIRVIRAGHGSAPLSVRKAWVGVRLVITRETDTAYLVNAMAALKVLTVISPRAANWWHCNIPPNNKHLLEISFAKHDCELCV